MPILKAKREGGIAGTIIKNREPDKTEENQEDNSLESHGKKVLEAIQANDPKRLAECIKALANLADSEPHEEGPHEPHSYDAQKE